MTDASPNAQPGPTLLAPLTPEDAVLYRRLREGGLTGQTVLHIAGSNARFGLHVLQAGAAQVSILAANRLTLEVASAEAAAAGLRPELIHGRLDRGILQGRAFDVIVCCLPDCLAGDPLAWLYPMMASAGRRLIAVVDAPGKGENGYGLARLLAWLPLAWLPRPAKPGRRLRRGFLMTPAAVRNILRYHGGAFEPASVSRSPEAGRLIVEARRRTIRHLVVVAGPSSSGKSTFAQRLVSNAQTRARFGLAGDWRHVRGRDVVNLAPGPFDNLIVELDLMAVETGDLADFDDIPQFHIARCAGRLTVLTVMPQPPHGHVAMTPAEAARAVRKCGRLGQALADFYAGKDDGGLVRRLYRAWFDWAAALGPAEMKLVVNDYSEFRQIPTEQLDDWLAKA
jgi:hypothetical protein